MRSTLIRHLENLIWPSRSRCGLESLAGSCSPRPLEAQAPGRGRLHGPWPAHIDIRIDRAAACACTAAHAGAGAAIAIASSSWGGAGSIAADAYVYVDERGSWPVAAGRGCRRLQASYSRSIIQSRLVESFKQIKQGRQWMYMCDSSDGTSDAKTGTERTRRKHELQRMATRR